MKRLIGVVVVGMALAGCATTVSSLTADKPTQVFQSQHSAADVATCIYSKWVDSDIATRVKIPGGDRIIKKVQSIKGIAVIGVADVIPSNNGSTVTYYATTPWGTDTRKVAVETCIQ